MGRWGIFLLDDGEVLVSDLACQYCLMVKPSSGAVSEKVGRLVGATRTGRLKVATRNVFFDSDDWRDPVVKIPISSMTCVSVSRVIPSPNTPQTNLGSRIHSSPTTPAELASSAQWRSPERNRSTSPRGTEDRDSVQSKPDTVMVESKVIIFQRENGADHPYVEEQVCAVHELTPTYVEGGVLNAELQSLKNINAIKSRKARDSALRELVLDREDRVPFDITLLQHGIAEEGRGDYSASAIYALSRAPGRVKVTTANLYFMPIHGDVNRSVERITLTSLISIRRLRHGCSDAALEAAYKDESDHPADPPKTLMLAFQTRSAREQAFATLEELTNRKLDIYGKNELDLALTKWRRGEMSNFDYLMYLNFAAGRSFNDLSQYPVFPWILSDYTSKELDLENPAVYRDLSKPIGALDENRLLTLKERFYEMPPPRFFYGTHYSTPAYVINYLVRSAPGAMLRLQNGRFDMPDRLFHSISETWKGVCTNQADVKELLPEFYTLDYSNSVSSGILSPTASSGQFLENVLGLELGTRQDGKRVDAVELPPWASRSSRRFIEKMREALDGQIVSEQIHKWIDLIFGVKSRSEDACNIFYTDVALPKSLDKSNMRLLTSDDIEQMETIYLEFGRTPEQLFFTSHPSRFGMDDEAPSLTPQPSLIPIVSSISLMDIGKKIPMPKIDIPSRDNSFLGKIQNALRSPRSKSPHSKNTVGPDEASGTLRNASVEKYSLCDPSLDLEIIDATLVGLPDPNSRRNSNPEVFDSKRGKVAYGLCTVWSDGNLRVHVGTEMMRSRTIEGVSAVVAMDTGLLGYGTANGAIGYYQINSGRTQVMTEHAHDSRVTSLGFVPMLQLLLSGSQDGSVKVWQLQRAKHGACALLCALELDAEHPVRELAAAYDEDGATETRAREQDLEWLVRRALIAAITADGSLLVWHAAQYTAGDSFLEPLWRRNVGRTTKSTNEPTKRMCWHAQRRGTSRAVSVVSACSRFVRSWVPGQEHAEIVIECKGATCVTSADATPTVIVADKDGTLAEFDSTGLRVGKRVTELNSLERLLMQPDGAAVFAISGRTVVRVVL